MGWDAVIAVLADDRVPAWAAGCLCVREPADRKLGNLGGTLHAWREACARDPSLPRGRVLMVHDAGAATRSSPWALALDGLRSALPWPGAGSLGAAVLAQLAALAESNPGGVVDVAWTSQLFDPAAPLPVPTAPLTKLVRSTAEPTPVAVRELGWFARDPQLDFAPAGTFADLPAWRRWADGRAPAADVGTFRATAALLTALADDPSLVGRDLDPGFTGPQIAAARAGRPAVPIDTADLGADAGWWRLRRGDEVLRALVGMARGDARLRAVSGVTAPVRRARLGGVEVDHLTWDEIGRGVQIGGVWLHDAIVEDADLAAGSRVVGSVVRGARGRVDAVDSAVLDAGDVTARGAFVLATRAAVSAREETAVDAAWRGERVRLTLRLDVDPRAVDDEVVPPNPCSFRAVREGRR